MREIESVSERMNLMWRPRSIFLRRTRQLVLAKNLTCHRRFWRSTIFVSALADRRGETADGLNEVRKPDWVVDFVPRRAVVTPA
jgi:hypothetical protein